MKLVNMSSTEFDLMALNMPTGRPMIQEIATPIIPISALMTPLLRIISIIGDLLAIMVLPNEPVKTSRIQAPYCTTNGRSRPRDSLIRAISSSDINPIWPGSKNATKGSPGKTRMIANIITVSPIKVGTARSNLLATYCCKARLQPL